jgi:prepilin-type N-terminal cleavage/methylation domain-containing protein
MPVFNRRRGYTLIELVVTILIIGVLTAIAVPQYLQTVETGYADDAAATVNMIGTTNKMFALDHNGYYATGVLPAAGAAAGSSCMSTTSNCTAGAAVCPTAAVAADVTNACVLVCCKYLADQDWGDKKYSFSACDPNTGAGGGAGVNGGPATSCGSVANEIAAARRGAGATANYTAWGYYILTSGQVSILGGTTTPPASF